MLYFGGIFSKEKRNYRFSRTDLNLRLILLILLWKTINIITITKYLGEYLTEALILITTEIGTMEKVLKKVKQMKAVQKANMITGPYDVMAIAQADDISEISNVLMEEIRNIDGVKETVTNVFIS